MGIQWASSQVPIATTLRHRIDEKISESKNRGHSDRTIVKKHHDQASHRSEAAVASSGDVKTIQWSGIVKRLGRRAWLAAMMLTAVGTQAPVAKGASGGSAAGTVQASTACDLEDCSPLGCDSSDSLCGCDGSACDDFGGFSCRRKLLGWIKPSDHCFDDFISPMINFVYFEDPRTLTEVRPIFVTQQVPDTIGAGIPAGGSAQLYALHVRVALSERLSFIAVKDGYIVDNTEGSLDTLVDDGWAGVAAGLKYNLFRDTQSGTLASTGFTYEIPMGSASSLQDIGDGQFHFFLTGGQRFLDGNAHLLTSAGYRVPVDGAVQTEAIHWSNHLDFRLTDRFYVFTEAAWWHWTDDATDGLPLGVAGQDLFNLSSTNVAGNDLVTQNVGMKFKPRSNIESGIAYEFPVTGFQDIIKDRLMIDLIIRY
jgi:hypothetical protein